MKTDFNQSSNLIIKKELNKPKQNRKNWYWTVNLICKRLRSAKLLYSWLVLTRFRMQSKVLLQMCSEQWTYNGIMWKLNYRQQPNKHKNRRPLWIWMKIPGIWLEKGNPGRLSCNLLLDQKVEGVNGFCCLPFCFPWPFQFGVVFVHRGVNVKIKDCQRCVLLES